MGRGEIGSFCGEGFVTDCSPVLDREEKNLGKDGIYPLDTWAGRGPSSILH